MFLHKLLLKDFRLFSQKIIEFDQPIAVIVAPNAGGKSTILEAISLLSSGSSFRASKVEEMVAFEKEISQIKAKILSTEKSSINTEELGGLDETQLSVLLTKGVVNDKRTSKLHFSVNDNKRRKKDFIGNLLSVVFRPEDMRLIEGSPSRRRDYLNSALIQIDRGYQLALAAYRKHLQRRNRLLHQVKEQQQPKSALTYWNMGLIKHGELIQKKRKKFVEFVNTRVESSLDFQIENHPSLISENRVSQYLEREIAAGFSLIGPHKDDFEVMFIDKTLNEVANEPISLDSYGSRGQKRMGVLWLKKAELLFLKNKSNETPLLLLDDILSELDEHNRATALKLVEDGQTIITTADPDLVKEIKTHFSKIQVINF